MEHFYGHSNAHKTLSPACECVFGLLRAFLRCCQKLLIKLYGKFAESVLRPATPT